MSTLSDYRKVSNIETLEWELLEEESAGQDGNTWWYNLSYDDETGESAEDEDINFMIAAICSQYPMCLKILPAWIGSSFFYRDVIAMDLTRLHILSSHLYTPIYS